MAGIEVLRARHAGKHLSETASTTLTLGPFDQLYIRLRFVVDIGLSFQGTVDVPRLGRAISASLVEFWPCSGRLRRSSHGVTVIEGCDAGVWFSSEASDDVMLPAEELPLDAKFFRRVPDPAPHGEEHDETRPLLSVKVTTTGSGFVLGISVAHVLADLKSTYDLVHVWALLYKDLGAAVPKPLHDREILHRKLTEMEKDANASAVRQRMGSPHPEKRPSWLSRALCRIQAIASNLLYSHPMSVVSFLVDDEELDRRKKSEMQASQEGKEQSVAFVSRNDIVNAMLLSLISESMQHAHQYTSVCLVLQFRGLLYVDEYFGNAVHQERFPLPRCSVASTLRRMINSINSAGYLSWRATCGEPIPAPLPPQSILLNSWVKGFSLQQIALGSSPCVSVGQLGSCGGAEAEDGFWAQRASAFHRIGSIYALAAAHGGERHKCSILMPTWAAFNLQRILRRCGHATVGVWTPPSNDSSWTRLRKRAAWGAAAAATAGLLMWGPPQGLKSMLAPVGGRTANANVAS